MDVALFELKLCPKKRINVRSGAQSRTIFAILNSVLIFYTLGTYALKKCVFSCTFWQVILLPPLPFLQKKHHQCLLRSVMICLLRLFVKQCNTIVSNSLLSFVFDSWNNIRILPDF